MTTVGVQPARCPECAAAHCPTCDKCLACTVCDMNGGDCPAPRDPCGAAMAEYVAAYGEWCAHCKDCGACEDGEFVPLKWRARDDDGVICDIRKIFAYDAEGLATIKELGYPRDRA